MESYCTSQFAGQRIFCPRAIYLWCREIWLERVSEGASVRPPDDAKRAEDVVTECTGELPWSRARLKFAVSRAPPAIGTSNDSELISALSGLPLDGCAPKCRSRGRKSTADAPYARCRHVLRSRGRVPAGHRANGARERRGGHQRHTQAAAVFRHYARYEGRERRGAVSYLQRLTRCNHRERRHRSLRRQWNRALR